MSNESIAETDTIGIRARELLADHASDGPIQMLNLLRFVPEGGEAAYMEYLAACAPIGERYGTEVVSAARPAEALIGERRWDLVLIVRHQSREAFIAAANDPLYDEVEGLRTRAVVESELHVMDPVTGLDPHS